MSTIVIVDDAPGIRMLLQVILETAGHEVIGQASDGQAGLALAETCRPDLLLVDMLMPRMDGVEVARRWRLRHPDTPVVMISSVSAVEKIRQAKEAGVFHYILKPFDAEKVLAVVAAATRPQPMATRESRAG